ncbi:chitin deacetylase, putative [Cryptococcus gattii WM276]|uniref:chitin deacetylase n=1 Tax=Cryptococcus gattii serotype B (strain WM276 / ATCC MYA-4071) TaxID=367775 RepID=E6R8B7_CRYGW|nr:chitin deacetylase, putative [Cryptococcus gattii WM276]ADV23067.1 chitin deacetylase, putative [Cryptococcus gattii WM276]
MPAFAAVSALLVSLAGVMAQTPSTSVDSSVLTQTAPTGPSGFSVPALGELTSGAPTDSTVALYSTFPAGATPTVSGAPVLPTSALTIANYPALDVIPPTNSSLVQEWLTKIDMTKVPSYNATTGDCSTDPGATSDGRCWWTCGGCTRATDIVACPDKNVWGLSYDDGPSPFTPLLIDYLEEKNIKTTFFVVGSRVLSRPEMLQTEYMSGHEISIHTWSHPALTTLTNEQIVAELAWTMKVIKDTIGVTPNTFRPPYGDIDDRVRAIAAQMGLTPVIWTSYSDGSTTVNFDTNDWHISGGSATGASSYETFEKILKDYAPKLNTGFITLEHDLYQQSVDLAVGYILPQVIANGTYQLKSIINCLGKDISEAYIETSSNQTTTQITSASGGSTYFQPIVGTATGSEVSAPSEATGSTAAGSAAITSGSAAGTGASGASDSSSSGSGRSATMGGALIAFAAVAVGIVYVA